MKKKNLLMMVLACALSTTSMQAQNNPSPSTSKEIFDFAKFTAEDMLKLFYEVHKQGRKYPTPQELEGIGVSMRDIEFVRSHVRPRKLIDITPLRSDVYAGRKLFANLPGGVGKVSGGYPCTRFNNDVFTMWNYTNVFGSWNHGFFQAPGSWVDAGHRNGTDVLSGIKFFESWTAGGGDQEYVSFVTAKDANGKFKYVEPMINCLMYFGSDGINYNWEDNSFSNPEIKAFHKELWKIAKQRGFDNYHSFIYTAISTLNTSNADDLLGTKLTGKTHDLMLNYSNGDFTWGLTPSSNAAEASMGTTDGVYAGVWIVDLNRRWTSLVSSPQAKKMNIAIWGEHDQSRFFSYNTGTDAENSQSNYQKLLERAFSGGNRNPLDLPVISDKGNNFEQEGNKAPLQTFCGLASFLPERTAISGNLPFVTHFILGNGSFYNYKGKTAAGAWYNMGTQDVVPTYRWLVCAANTQQVSKDIQPEFTHKDAYLGGSCLKLSGKVTSQGTDIVLYRTKLKVSAGNPIAKIATKTGKESGVPTNLCLILKKEGQTQWMEFPVGDNNGKTWEEHKISLSGLSSGDVITHIGLRVKGAVSDNYNMLVGKLELNDDVKATPAAVKDLMVEVKEETKSSLSVKLDWLVDDSGLANYTRKDYGLLYNDEANIDHFEIVYKNGAEGKVKAVGQTSSWATFVGNIQFESENDKPFIGVCAVSTDLKTYSPIVWVEVPRAAQNTLPEQEKLEYGKSEIDPQAAGYDIALSSRYLEYVKTTGADQDLNYTANGPSTNKIQYIDATNQVLKVKQGQKITLKFKAYGGSTDGLKWTLVRGYMDLNQSKTFEAGGDEQVLTLGDVRQGTPAFEQGFTQEITIPADARVGKSRFRIVFSDAWAPHPGPVGLTAKGYTIDFGVEITGDKPQRPLPQSPIDQGEPVEPDCYIAQNAQAIQTIDGGKLSELTSEGDQLKFENVEKAWVYTVDGRLQKVLHAPQTVSLKGLKGVFIIKMQNKNVIRSKKIVLQ